MPRPADLSSTEMADSNRSKSWKQRHKKETFHHCWSLIKQLLMKTLEAGQLQQSLPDSSSPSTQTRLKSLATTTILTVLINRWRILRKIWRVFNYPIDSGNYAPHWSKTKRLRPLIGDVARLKSAPTKTSFIPQNKRPQVISQPRTPARRKMKAKTRQPSPEREMLIQTRLWAKFWACSQMSLWV